MFKIKFMNPDENGNVIEIQEFNFKSGMERYHQYNNQRNNASFFDDSREGENGNFVFPGDEYN